MKLGNSKKFKKLEKQEEKLGFLLRQKKDERELVTRGINKEIEDLEIKWAKAHEKTIQQFFNEGGNF